MHATGLGFDVVEQAWTWAGALCVMSSSLHAAVRPVALLARPGGVLTTEQQGSAAGGVNDRACACGVAGVHQDVLYGCGVLQTCSRA
jgi:hypothetical protein